MAIVDQIAGTGVVLGVSQVSSKQLRQWAANNGYTRQIDDSVPADDDDARTIQWRHAGVINTTDAIMAHIQSTLALTDLQWSTAVASMVSLPV